MRQKPLGECLAVFPVHEMPTWDLLDDVLVLEHPRGAAIVGGLGDRIIESRKDDRGHGDTRLQCCRRHGGELSVIAEGRVQARPV